MSTNSFAKRQPASVLLRLLDGDAGHAVNRLETELRHALAGLAWKVKRRGGDGNDVKHSANIRWLEPPTTTTTTTTTTSTFFSARVCLRAPWGAADAELDACFSAGISSDDPDPDSTAPSSLSEATSSMRGFDIARY